VHFAKIHNRGCCIFRIDFLNLYHGFHEKVARSFVNPQEECNDVKLFLICAYFGITEVKGWYSKNLQHYSLGSRGAETAKLLNRLWHSCPNHHKMLVKGFVNIFRIYAFMR
jgi:hypothetical protein